MAELYFRQLLAGRDFARSNPLAAQMVNFVYAVGDKESGECVLIDPAWEVAELVDLVEADGMKLVGALATHFHPDHVGGDLMGMAMVQGLPELFERSAVKAHCQKDEVQWITEWTGVSAGDLEAHSSGDEVRVGEIPITLIHTPGHTPGSQCFLVENRLIAGDTLFLQGCGRTDLPGGDSEEIYKSLHQRLAHIPDGTLLFPGHRYSPAESATLGETRATNQVFLIQSLEDWKRFQG